MSCSVYLRDSISGKWLWDGNITHNLCKMAQAAGIYSAIWEPESVGIVRPSQLVFILGSGLRALREDPVKFSTMDAENGWGTFEDLVKFVEQYIVKCAEYPDAEIRIHR